MLAARRRVLPFGLAVVAERRFQLLPVLEAGAIRDEVPGVLDGEVIAVGRRASELREPPARDGAQLLPGELCLEEVHQAADGVLVSRFKGEEQILREAVELREVRRRGRWLLLPRRA